MPRHEPGRPGGEIAARREIVEAILRYGTALDARDLDGLVACFTDDVHLEYFDGAVVVDGAAAVRAFFDFDRGGGLPGLDAIVRTTHLWHVGEVTVEGDRASASTSCVAHLLGTTGGQAVLVTRGLRYVDRLRRTPGGWRIDHRRHLPDWETRAPAELPHAR